MSDTHPPTQTTTAPPPHSIPTPQDTGYEFTDNPWIRWRNTWRYVTGNLTPEGEAQYAKGRNDRLERDDCQRCEQQRDYLLQYSTSHPTRPHGHNTWLIDRRPNSPIHESENHSLRRRPTQRKHQMYEMHRSTRWGY